MEFDAQVVKLTKNFYSTYPLVSFPEILEKDSRSYNCLLVETHLDYYVCLPYRTHIRHKYAYKFKTSVRSRRNSSGIDYSKMVIIKDSTFISSVSSVIDQDEYRETMQNINVIVEEAIAYLDNYIQHKKGIVKLAPEEFSRRYACSTLPYFDELLGISK